MNPLTITPSFDSPLNNKQSKSPQNFLVTKKRKFSIRDRHFTKSQRKLQINAFIYRWCQLEKISKFYQKFDFTAAFVEVISNEDEYFTSHKTEIS